MAVGYRYEYVENTGDKLYNRLGVQDTGLVSGKEFLFISMTDRFQGIGPWQNLYRKDFLLKNSLFYVEDNIHEDNELLPRVMLAAKRVRSRDIPFYGHRISEGTRSNSRRYDLETTSRLDILKKLYPLIMEHKDDSRTRLALRNMLAFNLAELIRNTAMLPSFERRSILKELRSGRYIDEALHTNRKRTKFIALCTFVAPRSTLFFYSIYRSLLSK